MRDMLRGRDTLVGCKRVSSGVRSRDRLDPRLGLVPDREEPLGVVGTVEVFPLDDG